MALVFDFSTGLSVLRIIENNNSSNLLEFIFGIFIGKVIHMSKLFTRDIPDQFFVTESVTLFSKNIKSFVGFVGIW